MKTLAAKLFLTGLSCLTMVSLTRCKDDLENPHYPDVPSIKFKKIKFIEVGGVADYDTLKLTISYKDGDSDLGLSSLELADFEYPYQEYYFFIENGMGDTLPRTGKNTG